LLSKLIAMFGLQAAGSTCILRVKLGRAAHTRRVQPACASKRWITEDPYGSMFCEDKNWRKSSSRTAIPITS
jgi:hypothetical protein